MGASPSSRRSALHYRKMGLQAKVSEASPHQLISLLLEGACQRIALAQACLGQGEMARKGKAIAGACAIIAHLNESLDHTAGGEIAARLASLYDWLLRHLTQANVDNDKGALRESLDLLEGLHSTWTAIGITPQAMQAAN